MTNSPTPGPTPAPTTAWELLDNRFYLGGGLAVLAVVLLTLVVFYDMDPHQRKRVGLENITALNFACVDFVGDVMWMSVRLYRGGRDPEDYPASVSYGVASLVVLVFATAADALGTHSKWVGLGYGAVRSGLGGVPAATNEKKATDAGHACSTASGAV